MMRQSDGYLKLALTLVCLLCATNVHARRLMELDGIELHGTARIVEYSSATCHVLESNNTEEEYERLKVNEGQSLNLWQLDFTVYNGSGKALDHLIARYGIESPWPPCTNWSYKTGATTATSWSNESGHIQRTGQPYSVAPDETLTEEIFILVFHEDEPRFANWSVDYNFAEGAHATPSAQPPPTQTAELPPVPGLPTGIRAGDTCVGKAEGSSCWKELENQAGCYVWDDHLITDQTVTWAAGCTGGLAQGNGTLTWLNSDGEAITSTGHIRDGQRQGRWVIKYADGTVHEGPVVDGKRYGQWILQVWGAVFEGPYVDGKQHGQWVFRWANDELEEGPMVDGEKHGRWVWRDANGKKLGESIWENGKLRSME